MSTAFRRLTTLSSHVLRSQNKPLAYTFSTTSKLGASASTVSPAAMSQIKQLVDSTIQENNVVVFSKTYCPYCKKAKNTLSGLTDDMKVLELDDMDEGSTIQAYLKDLNNFGTVPQIFIRGKFIGGNSDLAAIPMGELKKRIAGDA